MSHLVEIDVVQSAAILWMSNPPSNVMSNQMLSDLADQIERFQEDATIDRIILTGGSYAFSTGCLIADLFNASASDLLFDLCRRVEQSRHPVIAAISGPCLDGGFEMALACHARVCAPTAQLGFPFARYETCPPSGALQRLVRCVGVAETFDIFLAATGIDVEHLTQSGCVDAIAENPIETALSFDLNTLRDGSQSSVLSDPRRFSAQIEEFQSHLTPNDPDFLWQMSRLIEGAQLLPYEQALLVDREYARDQMSSDRFAALTYAARAEHYASAPYRHHAVEHVTFMGRAPLQEWMASQAAAEGIGVHLTSAEAPIPEGTDLVISFDALDGPERFAQTVDKMRRLGDVPRFFVSSSLEDDWPALPSVLRSDLGGVEFAVQEGRPLKTALLCSHRPSDAKVLQGFLTQIGVIPIAVRPSAIDVTGRVMAGFAISYENLLRLGHTLDEIDGTLETLGFSYPFGQVARALGPEGVIELCTRFDVSDTPFYRLLVAQSVSFDPQDAEDVAQLADHPKGYLRHFRKVQRHALAGPLMILLSMAQDGQIERLSDIDVWLNEALGLDPASGGMIALAQRLGVANMRAVLAENAQSDPEVWAVPPILDHLIANGGALS